VEFRLSSKERIEQAKQDWKTGRFAAVPQEHEFIPLPELSYCCAFSFAPLRQREAA